MADAKEQPALLGEQADEVKKPRRTKTASGSRKAAPIKTGRTRKTASKVRTSNGSETELTGQHNELPLGNTAADTPVVQPQEKLSIKVEPVEDKQVDHKSVEEKAGEYRPGG